MATGVRTLGLEAFKLKVTRLMPQMARDQIRKANEKSADEFVELVHRNCPVDDDLEASKSGHLVDTLEKTDTPGPTTGVRVSIGNAEHDYPLHLEGGHKTKNGGHVPPEPFWNPARTVVNKRHIARARAALRKAAITTASGEGF